MAKERIIVIGAALAGPAAAARAREINSQAEILLLERNANVSYATCGLSYLLSHEASNLEALNSEKAEFFKEFYDIEARTHSAVSAILADQKQLLVKDQDSQKETSLPYDRLIVATGVASLRPENAPAEALNLVDFRTLADLETIQASLMQDRKEIVVLGAGPLGIEAVDGLLRAKARVHLIEKKSALLESEQPVLHPLLLQSLQKAGVNVILGSTVRAYQLNGDHIESIQLSDGQSLRCDLVINAIGVRPRTDLLAQAGAAIHADGSVIVDEHCQSSLPHIYVCGTAMRIRSALVPENSSWWPQASLADRSAQVAGENAAGGSAVLAPLAMSQIIRAGESYIGRVGLRRFEIMDSFTEEDLLEFSLTLPTHERYIQKAAYEHWHVYCLRTSGQVLALEAFGPATIQARLDAAAALIHKNGRVQDLAQMDLAYLPPLRPARDPLNTIGWLASNLIAGRGQIIAASELGAAWQGASIIDLCQSPARCLQDRGAAHMTLPKLRASLDAMDRSRRWVLVSESGRKAWLGMQLMRQSGFDQVAILGGGEQFWHRLDCKV
ncbi:MAG: FAD-dependent oxidoreductase [Leptospiraceae bacterium]|nr:FAD-dependent oxidoreductase [Leptospiraceae bacterium]